jgi:hypothetical protein
MTMTGTSALLRPALALFSGLALLAPFAAQGAAPTPDPSPAFAPQPEPFPSPQPVRLRATATPVVQHVVTVVETTPVAVSARPAVHPKPKPAAPPQSKHRPHRSHAAVRQARREPLRIPDHPPPAFVASRVLDDTSRRRVPLALIVALAVLTLASATLVRRVARETAS